MLAGRFFLRVTLAQTAGVRRGRAVGLVMLLAAGVYGFSSVRLGRSFFRALRTGHRPDGTLISTFMPWAR